MENILRLTVKKEIYDKLVSGELGYIYYEPKPYWVKRFAKNPNATFDDLNNDNDYKSFDVVEVSCNGETETYRFMYFSKGVTEVGGEVGLCVNIDRLNNEPESVSEHIDAEPTNDEVVDDEIDNNDDTIGIDDNEPDNEDDGELDETDNIDDYTECDNDNSNDIASLYNRDKSLIENIYDVIDIIGGFDNVAVVGVPGVIITSNGHIFGTKQYIPNMKNETEIRIPIGTENIVYDVDNDEDFLIKVINYLTELSKNYFLFIWKKGCNMVEKPNGEKYLKLKLTIKRNY